MNMTDILVMIVNINMRRKMNSREDILAEINMLKVLVWKLWEDRFDDIDSKEWDKMKKAVIKKMRKSETSDKSEK